MYRQVSLFAIRSTTSVNNVSFFMGRTGTIAPTWKKGKTHRVDPEKVRVDPVGGAGGVGGVGVQALYAVQAV
jgi:hypothetical protein